MPLTGEASGDAALPGRHAGDLGPHKVTPTFRRSCYIYIYIYICIYREREIERERERDTCIYIYIYTYIHI